MLDSVSSLWFSGGQWLCQDSSSLLVVDVVAESPAEKQGVRLGSRLAKINGMHVDAWLLPLASVLNFLIQVMAPS